MRSFFWSRSTTYGIGMGVGYRYGHYEKFGVGMVYLLGVQIGPWVLNYILKFELDEVPE